MPLLIIKSERKTDERGEENNIAFSLSSSLPSLAQKEFENEHDHFSPHFLAPLHSLEMEMEEKTSFFFSRSSFFRNGQERKKTGFAFLFFLFSSLIENELETRRRRRKLADSSFIPSHLYSLEGRNRK